MTKKQKILVDQMLMGGFLTITKSVHGSKQYRLVDQFGSPVITLSSVTAITRYDTLTRKLLKRDNMGRLTLHRTNLRRLHGKTYLKQQYKKLAAASNQTT